MDPRTVEINNLRILNDYLNQTIETMVRAQRGGFGQFSANGLSHSPFGVSHFAPFAANGFVDPTHAQGFNPYVASQLGGFGGVSPYAPMIDPFLTQRTLAHSWPTAAPIGMLGNPFWAGQWSPVTELVRQQQQLQALAAYPTLNSVRGAWGIPV
jgi:hypothetical protein